MGMGTGGHSGSSGTSEVGPPATGGTMSKTIDAPSSDVPMAQDGQGGAGEFDAAVMFLDRATIRQEMRHQEMGRQEMGRREMRHQEMGHQEMGQSVLLGRPLRTQRRPHPNVALLPRRFRRPSHSRRDLALSAPILLRWRAPIWLS